MTLLGNSIMYEAACKILLQLQKGLHVECKLRTLIELCTCHTFSTMQLHD